MTDLSPIANILAIIGLGSLGTAVLIIDWWTINQMWNLNAVVGSTALFISVAFWSFMASVAADRWHR